LSHAEIAALQNKTEEACRQALRRALIRLSAELAARGIEI
jgi:DNA-directed RNA polymerase specialized sigma24 family protein